MLVFIALTMPATVSQLNFDAFAADGDAAADDEDGDPGKITPEKAAAAKNSSANALRKASGTADSLAVRGYGIDVSYWQGSIDWEKVRADGVSFAFIRVAYRTLGSGTLNTDTRAIENISEAKDAGIKVGVYCFSTAISREEALEEAKYTLSLIRDCKIDYPVVYDHEGYTNSSNRNYVKDGTSDANVQKRTDNAIAFLEYIESQGYEAMIYNSASHLQDSSYWDTGRLKKYDVWMAQYYYDSSTNELCHDYASLLARPSWYRGSYRFWQGSSNGFIEGIDGGTDIDVEYYTDSRWGRTSGGDVYYLINGKRAAGLQNIGLHTYCFSSSGFLQYGEQKINGKWYYFDKSSGAMYKRKWKTYKNSLGRKYTVRYGIDGGRLSGQHMVGSSWYYFSKSDGARLTGSWKTLKDQSGHRYKVYYDKKGRRLSASHKIGKYYYYFDKKTGAMIKNKWKMLRDSKGRKYAVYYDKKGRRVSGSVKIKGIRYYFDKNTGALIS